MGVSVADPDGFDDLATAQALAPEALRAALDAHRRWSETGGAEGRQADLRDANLAGADLREALLAGANLAGSRLKGADLAGADLQGADLTDADLQGASLVRADLRHAQFRGAFLRDADLREADLTGARGLLIGQLGGTDLGAARLDDGSTRFAEGLANVAEASKITQGLFFTILFVCAYAWLTVASTRDAQLLNNAAPPQSRLPILGTDIPLVQFYLVAPLLLLCLYVYFHLCLQRLWEELGELPAVFPDGRSLDRKAYPWLMNILVRAHAARLKERRASLARWQAGMSVILAWGLVPMSIVIVWMRYLRAHDWPVTLAHVAIISATVGAALGFRRLAAATLRGAERRPFLWRRAWRDARTRFAVAVAVCGVAFSLLSFGAVEGVNPRIETRGVKVASTAFEKVVDIRHWIPHLFLAVGYNPFAQLDDANISVKPDNWSGGGREEELDNVRGADLEGRNLRYAAAYGAFCVNAYFKDADLRGTDLRSADLRQADLRGADLRGANLRSTTLVDTDFRDADLRGANLKETDFRKAKLDRAKLQGANLARADLTGADLTEANLRDVDLTDAKLTDAVLAGADLTGAIGLKPDQLAGARLDATTRVPQTLRVGLSPTAPARR